MKNWAASKRPRPSSKISFCCCRHCKYYTLPKCIIHTICLKLNLQINFVKFKFHFDCKIKFTSTKFFEFSVNDKDTVPSCSINPANILAAVNSRVNFTCLINGIPNPTVYWTKDKSKMIISKENVLEFNSLNLKDKGEYHCHAVNRKGRSHSSALVEVFGRCIILEESYSSF